MFLQDNTLWRWVVLQSQKIYYPFPLPLQGLLTVIFFFWTQNNLRNIWQFFSSSFFLPQKFQHCLVLLTQNTLKTHKSWQGFQQELTLFRFLSRLNELDLCGLFKHTNSLGQMVIQLKKSPHKSSFFRLRAIWTKWVLVDTPLNFHGSFGYHFLWRKKLKKNKLVKI